MTGFELKIAEKINPNSNVVRQSIRIPKGALLNIQLYQAACPPDPDCYSFIQFKNEILWVILSQSTMPIKMRIRGDGLARLILQAGNDNTLKSFYFNAYVKGVIS